jgi:D-alanine transfer protein
MILLRNIGPVVAAVLLFILTLFSAETITEKVLERFSFKPGVIEAAGSSQSADAFQGIFLQEEALDTPDVLMVYGSSEFSAESEFHPWKVFDGKPTGFVPFLVGRGGSQSLVHTLSLGAQGDTLKGKKVAVILSAQWFIKQGIKKEYLIQNFSPLQAYRILYDTSLSPELKKRIIARLLEYPEALQDHPTLEVNMRYFLDQEKSQGWLDKGKDRLMWAKGWFNMKAHVLRDVQKTEQFLPLLAHDVVERNGDSGAGIKSLDWDKLRGAAEQRGKELTGSNSFYVMDSYYTTFIAPEVKKYKGSSEGDSYYPSVEYQDLQILLDVLQEREAEALFIIVPTNGRWYDYIAFPQQARTEYYQKVSEMIQKSGFEAADFSAHEYEPYFLQDIMHLGWKGWVYVNEALDEFYHEGI